MVDSDTEQTDGENLMAVSGVFSNVLSRRPRLRKFINRVAVRYGGHRHIEVERFLKFAFVGIVGTIVDLGLTNILMTFVFHVSKENAGTPVLIASTIGFIAAVSNNFIWNRYWTYPDSRSHPIAVQLGQFFLVNLGGLLIRIVIISVLTVPFAALIGQLPQSLLNSLSLSKDTQALIGGDMALLASVSVVMMWNFFINRYWTYNDVK
jgi:putative flippase GtrA